MAEVSPRVERAAHAAFEAGCKHYPFFGHIPGTWGRVAPEIREFWCTVIGAALAADDAAYAEARQLLNKANSDALKLLLDKLGD